MLLVAPTQLGCCSAMDAACQGSVHQQYELVRRDMRIATGPQTAPAQTKLVSANKRVEGAMMLVKAITVTCWKLRGNCCADHVH